MEELGSDAFWEAVDRRVTVIAGDVGTDGLGLDDDGRAVFASCDTVIHSAATVSFDAPLTTAVEVNLLGPTRIAETLQSLEVTPHLVAVSTCYVAGNRRGSAPEQLLSDSPFHIDVDWRSEVEAARRARSDFDAESRRAEKLDEFELRPSRNSAPPAPRCSPPRPNRAASAGSEQLVEAGRACRLARLARTPTPTPRRSANGRSDESKGNIPVSIVRPSIIESAWSGPYPGWIGLPYGRAHPDQLRPGPAQRVPGRPRGCGRRHPRRPRRRRHHQRCRRGRSTTWTSRRWHRIPGSHSSTASSSSS
ncbi:MAG: SDR family oxidoreductase [Acidimicrobiales bacterium]